MKNSTIRLNSSVLTRLQNLLNSKDKFASAEECIEWIFETLKGISTETIILRAELDLIVEQIQETREFLGEIDLIEAKSQISYEGKEEIKTDLQNREERKNAVESQLLKFTKAEQLIKELLKDSTRSREVTEESVDCFSVPKESLPNTSLPREKTEESLMERTEESIAVASNGIGCLKKKIFIPRKMDNKKKIDFKRPKTPVMTLKDERKKRKLSKPSRNNSVSKKSSDFIAKYESYNLKRVN